MLYGPMLDYPRYSPDDPNLQNRWLDLPRRRAGLVVPVKEVTLGLCADLDPAGVNGPYLHYPEESCWGYRPLQATNCFFNVLRLGDSKKWKEIYECPENLLGDFVGLKDAPDEGIAAFAQKWGPIWLCHKHRDCLFAPWSWYESPSVHDCLWYPAEPVSAFRQLASQVWSLYNLGCRLLKGEAGLDSDWCNIGHPEFTPPTGRYVEDIPIGWQRQWLSGALNHWISLSGLPSLILDWHSDTEGITEQDYAPKMAIMPGLGFFPLVCLHLAQCVCGLRQVIFCPGCTNFYDHTGDRPRKGRIYLCKVCKYRTKGRRYSQKNSFRCPACRKMFIRTQKMVDHWTSSPEANPEWCDKCNEQHTGIIRPKK